MTWANVPLRCRRSICPDGRNRRTSDFTGFPSGCHSVPSPHCSYTMSHARRPLCCYLSCAATCHLFHSGRWFMGSSRGRGLDSFPPCGVKLAEQTDPQILHGRRKHRLDIWGQGRRQGLRGQIGVKKLRGPSVFTWGNRCYAPWWRRPARWIPCSL